MTESVGTYRGAVRNLRHVARSKVRSLDNQLRGVKGLTPVQQIERLVEAKITLDPAKVKARITEKFISEIQAIDVNYADAREALDSAIKVIETRIEADAIAAAEAQFEGTKAAAFAEYLREAGWKAQIQALDTRGHEVKVIGTPAGDTVGEVQVELTYKGATCAGGHKSLDNGRTLVIHSASAAKKFVELGV